MGQSPTGARLRSESIPSVPNGIDIMMRADRQPCFAGSLCAIDVRWPPDPLPAAKEPHA
jgi:hypothetical protein